MSELLDIVNEKDEVIGQDDFNVVHPNQSVLTYKAAQVSGRV